MIVKKILFIVGYLGSGGISKSLVNLLNAMDRSQYEVHLLIMSSKEGPYEIFVPEEVTKHRIPEIGWISAGKNGLKELLFHGHFRFFLGSLLRLVLSLFDKAAAAILMSKMYPKLEGRFDTIVEYNGQQDMYYMVDKLEGNRKISFFHSDYAKYPYYYKADKIYYPKVDQIYTISQTCIDSLKHYFPEVKEKIGLFENISLPSMIYRLADEKKVLSDYKGYVFTTVGLISYNKGFDLIVEAAKILHDSGVGFKWIMVGQPQSDSEPYFKQIKDDGLESHFEFVGVQTNPYPYMKRASIIVHTSRFEGKSIALDEAKILCKPIVVTNFSTVNDQFSDGINASICEMTSEALSDSIIELIHNPEKRTAFQDYLKAHIVDNSSKVNKLYQLLSD